MYVDGCFWHSCPEHATKPRNNAQWWADKLAANVARDRNTDERLEAAYLTLFSRRPTSEEKARWSATPANTPEDLLHALINTQQFIFVQ